MHRITQRGMMLFTLLSLPSAVLAGTTYNIQNYPLDQNGWTLTGTITTDGTQGHLSRPPDITSWTWTITKGANTYTTTSTATGPRRTCWVPSQRPGQSSPFHHLQKRQDPEYYYSVCRTQ